MAFSQPSSGEATFNARDNVGRLLLIYPTGYEEEIVTSFGATDAVRVNLVVLDGPDSPQVHVDQLLFQRALIGQLRSSIGKDPVLGRLAVGISKPGQSPPFRLETFTAADVAVAEQYLARHPDPFAGPAPAAVFTPPTDTAPAAADVNNLPPDVAALLQQMMAKQQQG